MSDKSRLAREKMNAAQRARRLAHGLLPEDVKDRLARFADEMEMEAAALERTIAKFVLGPDVLPRQQRQQQQVQQQQQTVDSPARLPTPKGKG